MDLNKFYKEPKDDETKSVSKKPIAFFWQQTSQHRFVLPQEVHSTSFFIFCFEGFHIFRDLFRKNPRVQRPTTGVKGRSDTPLWTGLVSLRFLLLLWRIEDWRWNGGRENFYPDSEEFIWDRVYSFLLVTEPMSSKETPIRMINNFPCVLLTISEKRIPSFQRYRMVTDPFLIPVGVMVK